MTDECTPIDYFNRASLVASNIVFIFTTIYCIDLTITRKLKWYSLIPEMFFTSAITVVSAMYHLKDSGDDCTRVDSGDITTLHRLDFIFSYQIIHVVFTYTTDYSLTLYKSIYLLLTLAANTIYVMQYDDSGYDNEFYAAIVACGVVVTIIRFLYMIFWKHDLIAEMRDHFDLRAGIPALICTVIGFACKIMSNKATTFTLYAQNHSEWHFFIGMAIYFVFNMYDIRPLCCRIKKQIDESTDTYVKCEDALCKECPC